MKDPAPIEISKEFMDLYEGIILVDPETPDTDEMDQLIDMLGRSSCLTSIAYVEGFFSPVLDTKEGERIVGMEAIRGYLQEQGRL